MPRPKKPTTDREVTPREALFLRAISILEHKDPGLLAILRVGMELWVLLTTAPRCPVCRSPNARAGRAR